MQCAIYSLPEMKLRLRLEKKGAVVLARYRGMLILRRDPEKDVWTLPYATKEKGETPEMTARRALAKALGDAEFDVFPLCGYSVTSDCPSGAVPTVVTQLPFTGGLSRS